MVHGVGQLAGKLEMLLLVLADGDVGGLVEEDVGGLQDGVGEEAELEGGLVGRGGFHGVRVVGHACLGLPLGHSCEIAHAGMAAQDPHELGVLQDVLLGEDDTAVGIQADGEQRSICLEGVLAQYVGALGHGNGVQVDDRVEDAVAGCSLILQLDPLSQGTQIVAQMRDAGGLDAREDGLGPGAGGCSGGLLAGAGRGGPPGTRPVVL